MAATRTAATSPHCNRMDSPPRRGVEAPEEVKYLHVAEEASP